MLTMTVNNHYQLHKIGLKGVCLKRSQLIWLTIKGTHRSSSSPKESVRGVDRLAELWSPASFTYNDVTMVEENDIEGRVVSAGTIKFLGVYEENKTQNKGKWSKRSMEFWKCDSSVIPTKIRTLSIRKSKNIFQTIFGGTKIENGFEKSKLQCYQLFAFFKAVFKDIFLALRNFSYFSYI